MLKIITILSFLVVCFTSPAQSPFESYFTQPKGTADTLYFAFQDGIQLVVIDRYDSWERQVAFKEATQPRGASWADLMGPAPTNIYIFRNKAGEILKVYNADLTNIQGLKNTDFINTNSLSLHNLQDCRELNNHLMVWDGNNNVGLIDLKGEIVVPAIYDYIRRYQDFNDKRDKLIIEKDGLFGLLDADLKVLFPPMYRTSSDTNYAGYPEHNILNGQYIKVFKDEKCGLINEKGDVLIDFKFDDLRLIHDSCYVGLINRPDASANLYFWHRVGSCVVYDKHFNQLSEFKDYQQIEYFGINRFIVKKDNKYGVLDPEGKVIVPLEYDGLSSQNGGYYVFKGEKSGMIDLEGNILLPIEFERNMYFYGQAIYVSQDGLIGVYSDKYKLIAKPQYKYKSWDMGKYVLTREDGSKGFVFHQNEGSYYQSPEGEIIKF